MFFVTVVSLLTLVSAYVGARLLPALPFGTAALAAGIAVLSLPVLLAAASLVARFTAARGWARRLAWSASLSLGWVSSLFVLTLLRELVLAIGMWLLAPGEQLALSEWSAVAVLLLAALATIVGLGVALGPPRIVDVTIPLPGLPYDLRHFTIVQISDLHVGGTIRRGYVQHLVERVNRLQADLVAITGDLVDGGVAELRSRVAPLADLRSRHGSYFVTGNHEYYSGAAAWIAELRRIGMHVLLNEHVVIRHGTAALLLAGVTDPAAQQFDPSQRSDPQAALGAAPSGLHPRILLAHRPGSAPAAERAGFDLQLSGHTHGGQFWPWNLVVRWREPLRIGLDRLNGLWVYTSRGTGFWGPPQRLGVPSEITRLTLVPSALEAVVEETPGAPSWTQRNQGRYPDRRAL